MPFPWVALALTIGSFIIQRIFRPKIQGLKPGHFEIPKATEDTVVPVVYGTVRVTPNIVGFTKSGHVTKKEHGVTVGFIYQADLQMILCHGPIDSIEDIYIDDRSVRNYTGQWGGSDELLGLYATFTDPTPARFSDTGLPPVNATIAPAFPWNYTAAGMERAYSAGATLDLAHFFGGPEPSAGGAFCVWLDVFFGSATQAESQAMVAQSGVGGRYAKGVSTYQKIAYVYLHGRNLGHNIVLHPLQFVVARFPNNIGASTYHKIGGTDANPAEIVYDLLTNTEYGAGVPAAEFNLTSFQDVAKMCFDEGFGLSTTIAEQHDGTDIVADVMAHADLTLYRDPTTSLLTLFAIRGDYTLAALPVLDATNVIECRYSKPQWEPSVNEVKVRFTNRADDYKTVPVSAQDLANIQFTGEVRSDIMDFPMVMSRTNAQAVASRMLNVLAQPLSRITLTVTRCSFDLFEGAPFILNWPDYGFTNLVCRVASIDYGSLGNGAIQIEAMQDVFGTNLGHYTEPVGSSWTHDPIINLPIEDGQIITYRYPWNILLPFQGWIEPTPVTAITQDVANDAIKLDSSATAGNGFLYVAPLVLPNEASQPGMSILNMRARVFGTNTTSSAVVGLLVTLFENSTSVAAISHDGDGTWHEYTATGIDRLTLGNNYHVQVNMSVGFTGGVGEFSWVEIDVQQTYPNEESIVVVTQASHALASTAVVPLGVVVTLTQASHSLTLIGDSGVGQPSDLTADWLSEAIIAGKTYETYTFTWVRGEARATSRVELWENTSNSFGSAYRVLDDVSSVIAFDIQYILGTTRYYWVRHTLSGNNSVETALANNPLTYDAA